MTDHVYTTATANDALEDLRTRLPRLREARRRLVGASARITDAIASDGGGVAGTDWFTAQTELKGEVEYLAKAGILLRDPEKGLVDFPAEREGRRVFLCWQLGEDDVRFFHEESSGFSTRKPW
ncbi:MAG: hypothetical protein QOE25_1388 [Actinomycetota bacterium]|nr:hypothetical protein [Actinomycetota bacterium]